jgi:hypothetical protein
MTGKQPKPMYLVTFGEEDNPYSDSMTAEAATAMERAEGASRQRPGILVRAWEAEHGELGFVLLDPPLAEFRDGVRVDIGG